MTIIDLVAYLYSDDGLVVSTQPERLQRAFDVLAGLFDWVGLRKNTVMIGGLYATGDRGGSNVLGAPAEEGGIPRVRSGSDSRLAPDTSS